MRLRGCAGRQAAVGSVAQRLAIRPGRSPGFRSGSRGAGQTQIRSKTRVQLSLIDKASREGRISDLLAARGAAWAGST
jgi:hypothetical protein